MENMEQNAPSVSVIIPVYNCAPYLRQWIDSVINQTEPSWEIICVDDGSTDDSVSILREFEEKLCGKMRVFVQENSGPAKARNSIDGKGHWHSNDPNGVNSTQELWNFFKRHQLNQHRAGLQ